MKIYIPTSIKMAEKSQPIEFTFYPPRGNPKTIFGSPEEQLLIAIKKAGVENISFKDNIFFAELKDVSDKCAVLPNILCRELKPGGKVHTKRHKGATPLQGKGELEKENKPPITTQKLFFVESTTRGITKIPSSAYDGKRLAVLGYEGDTLDDAIVKDGRFEEVASVLESGDRQAEVPLHYAVADVDRRIFTIKRKPAKRRTASLEKSEVQLTTSVFTIPGDLTDPFSEDIGRAAIESVRQNALELFEKSGSVDELIKKGIQQFGKENAEAIPAEILDTLARGKKSVGNIVCGGRMGTCFVLALLDGRYAIITSKHVFNIINENRAQTTNNERVEKIFVHFGDNYPEQTGDCVGEVDEKEPLAFYDELLDYAIMFLKPSPTLRDLVPLGHLVRSSVPCHGIVVLIGFPDNLSRKSVEVCRIIHGNWHATFCDRATKVLRNADESGFRSGQNRECVHMHKNDLLRDSHKNDLLRDSCSNEIPYDTSFFHGSSGSPVFNQDGHIIAMHTLGYPYFRGLKKYSIMEFGKSFGAIWQDIRSKHGKKWANLFFPECEKVGDAMQI